MKKLLTLAVVAASALASSAAVNPEDYPLLELGKDYELTQNGQFRGRIVAPEDGQMLEYGSLSIFTLDADGELQLMGYDDWRYLGYLNGRLAYQFAVKAGESYFIDEPFLLNGGTIRFEMNPKLAIQSAEPEQGSVYDPAEYEFVNVVFNQAISVGSVHLSCADVSAPVEFRVYGASFSLLIRDRLMQWLTEGKVKGGEKLTVELRDVTDITGSPIDNIALEFIASTKPNTMLSRQLPAAILSYMPQSGADTKAVFTFSGPMAENPMIYLCYSPIELGYEYEEKMEATVEGNDIIVDFAGKLRASSMMSASGAVHPSFDLRLYNLRDADGRLIMAAEGMQGSFHLQVPYTEIPRTELTVQFTPENGASLTADTRTIGIYFNHASTLTYGGVRFVSGEETVVVNREQLTVTDLGNDEVELTVPLPAGWSSKADVTVSLDELRSTDGYDHTPELSAKYNGFTLTFVNPADGSRLASLAKGSTVTVDSNLGEGAPLSFSVSNGGETLYGPVEMTAKAPGSYIHTMLEEITLYHGQTYTLTFSSGVKAQSISVYGSSSEYEYSSYELLTIDPAEGSTVTSGTVINLEFSGLVLVEAVEDEESAPVTAAPVNAEEGESYAQKWSLTLGKDVESGETVVAFRAIDNSDMAVKGNAGKDANSYFTVRYNAETGILEVESAPAATRRIFDLHGRELTRPVRGINIINGRKFRL